MEKLFITQLENLSEQESNTLTCLISNVNTNIDVIIQLQNSLSDAFDEIKNYCDVLDLEFPEEIEDKLNVSRNAIHELDNSLFYLLYGNEDAEIVVCKKE